MRVSAFQVREALVARVVAPPMDSACAAELLQLVREFKDVVRLVFVCVGAELTPAAVATLRGIAAWLGPDARVHVWGLDAHTMDASAEALGTMVHICDGWTEAVGCMARS